MEIAASPLAPEDRDVEPMRVIVEKVLRKCEEGLLVALVRAESLERTEGLPSVIIRMQIRLKEPDRQAGLREFRRLARDEALRFLDVS